MVDDDITEGEDLGDDNAAQSRAKSPREKGKRRPTAFGKVRRDLTDEELGQTGVQKLLLHQIEDVSERLRDSESYFSRFHQSEKLLAVANTRLEGARWVGVLEAICLTFGGSLFGLAKGSVTIVEGGKAATETFWDFSLLGAGLLMVVLAAAARFGTERRPKVESESENRV